MAYIHPKDRVLEHSTTAGTGPYALSGAIDTSFNAFSASMSIGDTTIGTIVEPGVAFWSGVLTYSAANQITRTGTAFESKGTFGSGTKEIFMGGPASRTPLRDSPNTFDGIQTFTNTSEATTGGVGALMLAGGLYAAKRLIAAGAIIGLTGGGGTGSSFQAQHAANPGILFNATGNALNAKKWDIVVTGNNLAFRTLDDGETAAASALVITRNGNAIDYLSFPGTTDATNANSAGAQFGGGVGITKNLFVGLNGTFGLGSAATNIGIVINGGSNANNGAYMAFNKASVAKWTIGHISSITGGSADDFIFYNNAITTGPLSTGLRIVASNGAVVLPGDLYVGNGSATTTQYKIFRDGGSAAGGGPVDFWYRNAVLKWQIGFASAIVSSTNDNFAFYRQGSGLVALTFNGDDSLTTGAQLNVGSSAGAASSSSAALVVNGGIGVYSNVYIGAGAATSAVASLSLDGGTSAGGGGILYYRRGGTTRWYIGAESAINTFNTGLAVDDLRFYTNGYGSALTLSYASGAMTVHSLANSVSTVTGALIVGGGVGIGGDLNWGGVAPNGYTPTVTAGNGGAYSNASASMSYKRFGKLVVWSAFVTIANGGLGTAGGYCQFSMPSNMTYTGYGQGECTTTGDAVHTRAINGTTLQIVNYNNAGTAVDNRSYGLSGFYFES